MNISKTPPRQAPGSETPASPLNTSSQRPYGSLPRSQSNGYIELSASQRAIAREYRNPRSAKPGEALSLACADKNHFAHDGAIAICEAWRPKFKVVKLPPTDPTFANSFWQVPPTSKAGGATEDDGDFFAEPAEDTEKREAKDLAARNTQPEAELPEHDGSLAYLDLARKHPHLTSSERETLAEGIYRYGTYLARMKAVLREGCLVEDAANGFAAHAVRLMDKGKYQDKGTFRGWLSSVWASYHWQAITEKATLQRNTEKGLQYQRGEEGERPQAGRVFADVIENYEPSSDKDADSDASVTQSLLEQLLELYPKLPLFERRVLDGRLAGVSTEQIAQQESFSAKTIQEAWKRIQAKAQGVTNA